MRGANGSRGGRKQLGRRCFHHEDTHGWGRACMEKPSSAMGCAWLREEHMGKRVHMG
jgi:hypothetical protein